MFTPTQEQQLAINDCKKFLKQGGKKGICTYSGAGGKSVIIAKVAEYVASFPHYRVLIVTHRKKLLEQNEEKVNHHSVGIVSAGLNRFEYDKQIVIGGIQTIYNKKDKLGDIKLILLDETQRLSNNKEDDSMYWELINSYPDVRLIGFTALPHRMKDGILEWGEIFHITTYEHLLERGYVTRLSNKVLYKPNLKDVKKVGGEYNQKDFAEKKLSGQFIENSANRAYQVFKQHNLKRAIAFAPTIEYANIIAFALHEAGFKIWSKDGLTGVITSKTAEEDEILKRHRAGEYDVLVSVLKFTEGYDDIHIDCILDFAPTMSLSLHHQKLLRGARLADKSVWGLPTVEKRLEAIKNSSKPVCYVLDFAGNLKQHGGLVDTSWKFLDGKIEPIRKTQGKVCPACEELIPIASKKCPECGYVPTQEEIEKQWEEDFDDETDINEKRNPLKWYRVKNVKYEPDWISSKGNKMLRVTYQCGIFPIMEYVFNNQKLNWLKQRGYSGKGFIDWDNLKKPDKIQVNTASTYPKIVKYGWAEETKKQS